MKKIIFFCLIFFSHSSYSLTQENFDFNYGTLADALIGTTGDCFITNLFGVTGHFTLIAHNSDSVSTYYVQSCFFLGWFDSGFITFVSNYPNSSTHTQYTSFFPPPVCPESSYVANPFFRINTSSNLTIDSVCLSDCSAFGLSSDECSCPSVGTVTFKEFFVCEAAPNSPTRKSQFTAIAENDLLSESNSKLGAIAATNSTITNLLKQIKDALLSLNSANFGIFGTNAPSSDSSNKDNSNSPEYEPTLSSSEIDLVDISPLITGKSKTCPSDISIDLAGSSHHISFQPLCDFSQKMNPIVVAAARVSAAWIVLGAL